MQGVDDLLVIPGTQCGDYKTLGLAACEQCRPVGTWQQAGFTYNWPDSIQRTTVDPLTSFNHIAAQNAGFEFFHSRTKIDISQLLFI